MFNAYPKALEQCTFCPRLTEHREAVAKRERMIRHAYDGEPYWGRPVSGFGDTDAQILLLGLAPGAHGSNRTGRMFTGDASGDFLYPALHRVGLASQAQSLSQDDGMVLNNIWITAACRCVPPSNKPTREEVMNCQQWLEHDFSGLKKLKLVLAIGSIGHNAYLDLLKGRGQSIIKKNYTFKHGQLHEFENALPMLDTYHVSFQNTNTGKLTEAMFDDILRKALTVAQ